MSKGFKITSMFFVTLPGFGRIFPFYKEARSYGLLNSYLKENPIFKHELTLIFF